MQIGELFVKLGVKTEEGKLQKFTDAIGETQKTVAFAVGSFIAAAFAIDKYTESVTKSSIAEANFNQQTGLSIDKLRQWQVAGVLSDTTMSFEQITESIKAFQKNLVAIRLGGGDSSAFQRYGISNATTREPFELLEELRSKIEWFDSGETVDLLQRMGLDPRMINSLRITRSEFDAMNKNFLNERQRQNLIKMGTAITSLKLDFKNMFDEAGARIAPFLTGLFEVFSAILKLTRSTFKFQLALSGVGDAMQSISGYIEYLKNGIILMINIIEDLFVFLTGGDSLIGLLIDSLEVRINKIIDKIKDIKPPNPIDFLSGLGGDAVNSIRMKLEGLGGGGTNKRVEANTTFNIYSNGDAIDIKDEVSGFMGTIFNNTYDGLNNGAVT